MYTLPSSTVHRDWPPGSYFTYQAVPSPSPYHPYGAAPSQSLPSDIVIDRAAEVSFSNIESAPQLAFSRDMKQVTGDKGYCMAKATDGVRHGHFYWECEILEPETPNAHYRIGWAQQQADNQAPVGFDKFSWAYRDVQGSKVHQSVREDGYGEDYGPGDIVGVAISLVESPDVSGYSYTGPAAGPEEQAFFSLGNHIRFFKNGKDNGPAYTHIPSGRYFPAVSIYMAGRVRANFGPLWICDPRELGCQLPLQPVSLLRSASLVRSEYEVHQQHVMERRKAWQERHGQ